MYQRSSFRPRRRGPALGTIAVTGVSVLFLFGLFAYGIWWFRFAPKDEPVAEETDSIANVLTPSPVSAPPFAKGGAATIGNARDAKLRDVSGGSASGTASRENDDGQFFLKLKASFPEIDRETTFYEAWIVRQVPYDYVSVGEFVTNDDGEWVLEWAGAEGKYDAYTRVIVTREAKDGNPDPAGHILEGEFE